MISATAGTEDDHRGVRGRGRDEAAGGAAGADPRLRGGRGRHQRGARQPPVEQRVPARGAASLCGQDTTGLLSSVAI